MLNIGLIGVGHLGKIHLKLLKEISDFNLIGFYDSRKETRDKVEKEFKVKAYANLNELIDACDALDIVTPTISHYDIAKTVLKKSKHVFIEKPLTKTLEEGKNLVDLSYEANVTVQVGHVERFNPAFLGSASFIKNPMFVEVHRLAQFNPRGTDVSVVLDLMIHDIDIVLSVVKSNVKRISASGVAVVSQSPDICNARIEFDNGCVANLTASRISMKNMRKARFFQKDAYIAVDFLDKKTEIFRLEEIPDSEEIDEFDLTITTNEGNRKRILMEFPEVQPSNAIKEELISFANAIRSNSKPEVSVEDGYNALEVAFAIIEKMNSNIEFQMVEE